MKTRAGFVSNSSSSSFVISVPKNVKPSATIRINLEDFIDETIKTKEELEQYMPDQYGDAWREDDYSKKLYAKMLKQIKAGDVVYTRSASNGGGDAIGEYLANEGIAGLKDMNFTVIDDSG